MGYSDSVLPFSSCGTASPDLCRGICGSVKWDRVFMRKQALLSLACSDFCLVRNCGLPLFACMHLLVKLQINEQSFVVRVSHTAVLCKKQPRGKRTCLAHVCVHDDTDDDADDDAWLFFSQRKSWVTSRSLSHCGHFSASVLHEA